MVKTNLHKILFLLLSFMLFACSSKNSPTNSNDDVQITPVSFVKSNQLFNLASVCEIAAGDFDLFLTCAHYGSQPGGLSMKPSKAILIL